MLIKSFVVIFISFQFLEVVNLQNSQYDDILNSIFKTNSKLNLTNDCDQANGGLCDGSALNTPQSNSGFGNSNIESGSLWPNSNNKNVYTTTTTETAYVNQEKVSTNQNPNQISDVNSFQPCGENKICVPFYLCDNETQTVGEYGENIIDIRFNDEKPCKEYLKVCCKSEQTTSTPNTEETISHTPLIPEMKPGCGHRNSDGIFFRITGQVEGETEYGEFPWMIALIEKQMIDDQVLMIYKCGGSLIHPSVILTAAHCVHEFNPNQLIGRAGEWDTQTKDELYEEQDRQISSIIFHENFNRKNLINDIALLMTEEPFKLSIDVNTICLPPYNQNFEGSQCYASGWGKDIFGEKGRYQVILKKLRLPFVNHDDCQDKLQSTRLTKKFKLHPTFICAGGEIGVDACKGDGGGPLVCPIPDTKDRYYQSGIVAWGIGCGSDVPGVYASVSYFRDWIDNYFEYHKLDKSYYTPS